MYSSTISSNKLRDETGNGRDATCVGVTVASGTGNGATSSINYIQGTTTSTIQFPTGSLAASGCVCAIVRYASATNRQRILQASGVASTDNRVYGHHIAKTGVVSDGTAQRTSFTASNPSGSIVDRWLVLCFSAGLASPGNVLVDDGVAIGISSGSSVIGTLSVNIGVVPAEPSDFQIAQTLLFDVALTAAELKIVSVAYNNFLENGAIA